MIKKSKDSILLVEDSKSYSMALMERIKAELHLDVIWVDRYSKTQKLLEAKKHNFSLALLDLNLTDAPHGEIVDLVLSYKIPSVVVTGEYSDDVQEFIWTKSVIDYVIKEGLHTLDYIIKLIKRVRQDKETAILIVDDSATARTHLRSLLEVHQYQILEACNGYEALKILQREDKKIKLILIDYYMPKMDGYELVKKIRERYSMDRIAIIGLSAQGNHRLSVKFIKHGANDFISKPFFSEQLYCRVRQNVELVNQFETIRSLSHVDFLTKAKNRRYLYDTGVMMVKNAMRSNVNVVTAMIDIDLFKSINDSFGHSSGDAVLKQIASIITKSFRSSDITARIGGEEFCVLAINMDEKESFKVFENLRIKIEKSRFFILNKEIKVTVSIGICKTRKDSLEEMIQDADEKLYKAKSSGRNTVCI